MKNRLGISRFALVTCDRALDACSTYGVESVSLVARKIA
jgi:hypothetical protein